MTDTPAAKPIRSFVAVPLPAPVRASVFAAAGALAAALPGVRWSRKLENLHVTIKFLGPVEEARLAAFGAALGSALALLPRFAIEVRGMGAFPSARHATVLWAGVSDGGRLGAVATIVEQTAARLKIGEPALRTFRAHVTVGRSKDGVDTRAALGPFEDCPFGTAPVDEVCVFESQLARGPGAAGSTYITRYRAALAFPQASKLPPASN